MKQNISKHLRGYKNVSKSFFLSFFLIFNDKTPQKNDLFRTYYYWKNKKDPSTSSSVLYTRRRVRQPTTRCYQTVRQRKIKSRCSVTVYFCLSRKKRKRWSKEGIFDPRVMSLLFAESGSPGFEKFLDILGEKIRLRGWDKYRGGLDVKGTLTIMCHSYR